MYSGRKDSRMKCCGLVSAVASVSALIGAGLSDSFQKDLFNQSRPAFADSGFCASATVLVIKSRADDSLVFIVCRDDPRLKANSSCKELESMEGMRNATAIAIAPEISSPDDQHAHDYLLALFRDADLSIGSCELIPGSGSILTLLSSVALLLRRKKAPFDREDQPQSTW